MTQALRILYAEDDSRDADLTLVHFAEYAPEFEITTVGTGRECLNQVRAQEFDLLLLDHRLPDMYGLDVLRELFHAGIPVPVVLVTGVGDSELVAQANRLGAVGYLPKQDNYLENLPGLLRDLIAKHRARKAGQPAAVTPTRVLYIEHQQRDVELTLRKFSQSAPQLAVDVVGTCAEARGRLQPQHEYDLVLCGLETTDPSSLHCMRPGGGCAVQDIPIVVLAGRDDEATAVAAFEGGAVDFIIKRDGYLNRLPHVIETATAHERLRRAQRALMAELAARERAQHRLEERVKELRAFSALSATAQREDVTLSEVYQKMADILPASWQHTEVAVACIVMDGREFRSHNFAESRWKQVAPIRVMQSVAGSLEVGYLEERPQEDEGPFLREERQLLDDIAEQLGRITHRYQMEQSLRESELRWKFAVEGTGDGLWDWDMQTSKVYFSPQWKAMLGFAEAELGDNLDEWARRVHPDDMPWVSAAVQAHVDGKSAVYQTEHRVSCKDGTWKWVFDRGVVMSRDAAGTPLRMIGTHRDITDRKAAEATLRLQGAALAAAANTIIITDREGVIEWVNAAFTASTGYGRGEAIGRTLGKLVNSGTHDRAFYAQMWEIILAGKVWQGETVNRRKDGSLYTEEMTITPLQNERGEITHFIAVQQDVTDRKALEEQFRQAQKLESIGLLAGGVAHDFNNMLSVILGRTELALLQLDRASPIRAGLTEVHTAATRSAELTRQLLTFARKQDVSPMVLDLNVEVKKSLKMLERLIREDVALVWHPAPSVWPVSLDPSQLDQILANLAVNARDAIVGIDTPDAGRPGRSGTVSIQTANRTLDAGFCATHADATPGDYVELTVADDGDGMSGEVQARIFEPFFTTKPLGVGTGLGLATVFGAVRQNGGFIAVSSVVGKGTTFALYLPRHTAPTTEASQGPAEIPAARGTETILLVEDESMILNLTTETLQDLGYTVFRASNAVDALRQAAEHAGTIDLLLSDVVMPGMSGRELADTLQKCRPGLRRLFMSGYATDRATGERILAEEENFIGKPFSRIALASKVREVLDNA